MMTATLTKKTEQTKALSAVVGNGARAQGHVLNDGSVYIPDWVGVKGLDREIVVEDCYDVDEAVKALSKYKRQNVLLLIRYTDGSRVITCCDMKTDRILASWLDDLPVAMKQEIYLYCIECGCEFASEHGERMCARCAEIK